MNTEEPIRTARLLSSNDRHTRIALLVCLGLFAVLAVLAGWQTELPLCPASRIRVVDESAAPVQGVRVAEQWGLSVLQNGEVRELTDLDGWAVFQPVTVPMSMLRRLHIKLQPSARGLGYENYASARFRVFLPLGSTAQRSPGPQTPFPASAPFSLSNDQGMIIREFRQRPNRAFNPSQASEPPRARVVQTAFVDVFFPPGHSSFELRIRKPVEK